MARIRTIKPEFPQSESMGRVSRDARLLFVQLWTICDDSGRTRAASRMLASLLYPYDDDAPSLIDGWLDELEREGCIVRYGANGCKYLEVSKWSSHQKIDKPSKSKFPPFDESSRDSSESSRDSRERSSEDQGPRTKERTKEGKGTGEGKPNTRTPRSRAGASGVSIQDMVNEGVPEQLARDWMTVRGDKRAKHLTATAWAGFKREVEKAGFPLQQAVEIAVARNWVGFNAGWVKDIRPATGSKEVAL